MTRGFILEGKAGGGGGQPCPQNWELLCDKRFAS